MKILITKIVPYKDKDCIISGFNENQNFSILVRGMQNPKGRNAALNNIMTYADIELNEPGKSKYDVLKSSTVIFSPLEFIGNIQGLTMIVFIGELIVKCLSEDEKSTMFKEILATIKSIKKDQFPRFNLLNLTAKILHVSGYSFNVDECQTCGSKKEIVGFSMNDGGFICKNCLKDVRDAAFNADQLIWLRRIFKNTGKDKIKLEHDMDKVSFKKILGIMVEFIQDNYGLKLTNCELLID